MYVPGSACRVTSELSEIHKSLAAKSLSLCSIFNNVALAPEEPLFSRHLVIKVLLAAYHQALSTLFS